MRFVEDCDFEVFKRYLRKMGLYGKKEDFEELRNHLKTKLLNLIVWKEDNEIIGHALWHESNTEEHRNGDSRDKEDRETIEKLAGGKKSFVELHEVWLDEQHRGKGFGKEFFEFFEDFIRSKGYDSIVYYAYHPAAVAICRQHGYKEAYGIQLTGPKGETETCYTFYLLLKKNSKA